ncbi:MAG: hypothetical protein KY455_07130 [Euryarchaeota archaeon]|nr:hypothetical protein [Euryarchaeota archaeon]
MAKESTFPAEDVPDRRERILAVLEEHDPVPVPTTTLYLSIEDKRHLAEEFDRLVAAGEIEQTRLDPGDPHYKEAMRLAGLEPTTVPASLRVYRRKK